MKALFSNLAEVQQQRSKTGELYREFLRVQSMSAGLYVLPAGGTDRQHPHHEDEMYYVIRGTARFRADGEECEVSGGSVLFVPAEVVHRFYDISEELHALVFFSPAENYGG